MIVRGSSGLKARVGRRHRGRCAAIRVFSVLGFGLGFPKVWARIDWAWEVVRLGIGFGLSGFSFRIG